MALHLLAFLLAPPALACSCKDQVFLSSFPDVTSGPVPLDATFVLAGLQGLSAENVVLSRDGEELALWSDGGDYGSLRYVTVDPEAPLSAGEYSFDLWGVNDESEAWDRTLAFTVGDTVDTVPPAPIVLEAVSLYGRPGCCGGYSFQVNLEGERRTADLLEFEVERDGSVQVSWLFAEDSLLLVSTDRGGPNVVWDEGGAYEVRMRVHDASGNLSDWSDPISVTVPDGCGCTQGSVVTGWAGALIAGVLTRARRRRRKQP